MDVRCPNCGTSFVVGDGSHTCVDTRNVPGIGYLVPDKVRNENKTTEYGTVNEERKGNTVNNN